MTTIEAVRNAIEALPADERKRLEEEALAHRKRVPWVPNPGPQTEAYYSKADVLLYGGAAGGGKTDLLLGLGLNEGHKRSRIFRKLFVELKGLEERSQEIMGGKSGYSENYWRLKDSRSLEFAAMQHPGDEQKYQGRARDFIGVDEAAQFPAAQIRFVLGWLRSADEGQRCRAVLASNPPLTAEGEWLVEWFAPWLDPDFTGRKAKPGELRWSAHIGDEIVWLDGPEPYEHDDGETYRPMSYTFIPANLDDNPDIGDEYRAKIQAFPEPMRSKLLYGSFLMGGGDDAFQVIPSDWIRIAQDRWDKDGNRDLAMTSLGVDVAQGGSDKTTMVRRHDWWFSEVESWPGAETPDGPAIAALAVPRLRDGAAVHIDVGGGWGNDAYRILNEANIAVAGLSGAERSIGNDRSGKLKFANKRAEWWWGFREALDPERGAGLALPPGRELMSDLSAPRYTIRDGGRLLIESKADIRARLGRSPDMGDAVVYAYADTGTIGGALRQAANLPAYATTKRRRR